MGIWCYERYHTMSKQSILFWWGCHTNTSSTVPPETSSPPSGPPTVQRHFQASLLCWGRAARGALFLLAAARARARRAARAVQDALSAGARGAELSARVVPCRRHPRPMTSRLAPASRHAFRHEGRVVYEWEQTIEEVCLFVQVPAGVRARDLGVSIAAREVSVGIRGNPPYLQHALHAPCVTADSTWTLDGGELAITLAKVRHRSTGRGPGKRISVRCSDAAPPAKVFSRKVDAQRGRVPGGCVAWAGEERRRERRTAWSGRRERVCARSG